MEKREEIPSWAEAGARGRQKRSGKRLETLPAESKKGPGKEDSKPRGRR